MINQLVKKYLAYRLKEFEYICKHPIETQDMVYKQIIQKSASAKYLADKGIHTTSNYTHFSKHIGISEYSDLYPLIDGMMRGGEQVLLRQKVKWYSKSSGTSTGQSKYLPLTRSFLMKNHIRGSWYAAALVYKHNPDAKIFKYKNLLMGGSIERWEHNPKIMTGDISGFTISNIPAVGRPFYSPDFKTALIDDWDQKIDRMAEICPQHEVFLFAGVPTWTMVLFEKIMAKHGAKNMLEIWPHAQVYMHGGVNFNPYRSQFETYLPKDDFHYMEVYNASEGFFAIQYDKHQEGMMLLLNNEVFYEFMPIDDLDGNSTVPLEGVRTGVRYAMVITTSSGLYRYMLGDVIMFTSTKPHLIKVVGRTKEYLNAFGEELMIDNAEKAIEKACNIFNASISNYSVAPVYLSGASKGRHQWLIEFRKAPQSESAFAEFLDGELQRLNSDYTAKRYKSMALECLEIVSLKNGTFERWLRSRGKFGNQNKVPRLKNDRSIADELLKLV